jgi:hypothetical protein
VLEACQCVESERALSFQAHAIEEFAGLPCAVLKALMGGAISSRFVTRLTSRRPRTPAIGQEQPVGWDKLPESGHRNPQEIGRCLNISTVLVVLPHS